MDNTKYSKYLMEEANTIIHVTQAEICYPETNDFFSPSVD